MDLKDKISVPNFNSDLERNLFYLTVCVFLVAGMAAANNLSISGDSVEVGYTEIHYECVGLNLGICLGIERAQHQTYNYDNYQKPEPGTENYYRRVESELMLQAYNICENKSLEGMEWVSEASYENKTGEEWLEQDEVDLLSCDQTYRYQIDE